MTTLDRLTFVLGGARSGKSRYAEALLSTSPTRVYVATAQAFDDDMRERIEAHRSQRGPAWHTVEAPIDLPAAVAAHHGRPVLVDCLTVWLGNLMHADADIGAATERLLGELHGSPGPLVVVSNEVGLGIVPDNAMARRFRDHAGRLNQAVAACASRVVLVTAGLPLTLKGS